MRNRRQAGVGLVSEIRELYDEDTHVACPLDRGHDTEEWGAFLQCARRGFETSGRLHNEFTAKIAEHGVTERDVERALHRRSHLLRYDHEGLPRLGLWDPKQGLLVIATLPAGLFFNALWKQDIIKYAANLDNVQWLKQG